jgi:hypothetical protein
MGNGELAGVKPAQQSEGTIEPEATNGRGWLRTLLHWGFGSVPLERIEVSEMLEAHRMAWLRIEMRRQEFMPPDMAVAQRIIDGYGRTSKTYYGYERKSRRELLLRARL